MFKNTIVSWESIEGVTCERRILLTSHLLSVNKFNDVLYAIDNLNKLSDVVLFILNNLHRSLL